MVREKLNKVIETIVESYSQEEIREIKNEFQKSSGQIFEDDRSYDSRMASFLEWFTLDRLIPGTKETDVERYIHTNKNIPQGEFNIYHNFTESVHGIFVVKKIKSEIIKVLNLFDGNNYWVDGDKGRLLFQKNDVFEGRLICAEEKYYFTGTFCFHPPECLKFIKSETKDIRQEHNNNLEELEKLEKIMKSLTIKFSSFSSDIDKIIKKIEQTESESKSFRLSEKLNDLEEKVTGVVEEKNLMESKIADWERNIIKIEGREKRLKLIHKLAYMNLKWERSRQIDLKDIYKN